MDKNIEVLGAYVHGALSFGHALGVVYNIRRRNWWDALLHSAVFVYDLHSAYKHYKDGRSDE